MKGREGKGREGKGREVKGREGKGREGKGWDGRWRIRKGGTEGVEEQGMGMGGGKGCRNESDGGMADEGVKGSIHYRLCMHNH